MRADPQRHAVEIFRQRLLVGEENFPLSFHDGHMHRLNIGGNHLQLRQQRLKLRQRGAQLGKLALRAQDKAQHHTAVEPAFGQQNVLQLSAPAGDMIGREPGAGDKRLERSEDGREALRIKRAVGQVFRGAITVQHPEQRALHATADHHFRFVAKPAFRPANRCAPVSDRRIGEKRAQIGHFIGELLGYRQFQPLAGAAATRVIKCAMHNKTFIKTGAGIVSPLL